MKFPEKYRVNHHLIKNLFFIDFRGRTLGVIASLHESSNGQWEHVSVSLKNRNPNWEEMCYVKKLFWGEDEECIQFHPRQADNLNLHQHCLHIWKPPFEIQEKLKGESTEPPKDFAMLVDKHSFDPAN